MRVKQFVIVAASIASSSPVQAAFVDPGFENYAVDSGGFVKPTSGPWTFENDAGVVQPIAPNSSTAVLNTWSATFAAVQGEQYASTYASLDRIFQSVELTGPGEFVISVRAASPDGQVTIPGVDTLALVDAGFRFILDGSQISDTFTIAPGTSWQQYSATFSIPAGTSSYSLGVQNTLGAPYFINYDDFTLQSVPEPSAGLLAGFGVALLLWRLGRRPGGES